MFFNDAIFQFCRTVCFSFVSEEKIRAKTIHLKWNFKDENREFCIKKPSHSKTIILECLYNIGFYVSVLFKRQLVIRLLHNYSCKKPHFNCPKLQLVLGLNSSTGLCTKLRYWKQRGPTIWGWFHQSKEMDTCGSFTYSFSFSLCTCQTLSTQFVGSWGRVFFMSCLSLYQICQALGHLLGLGLDFSKGPSHQYPTPFYFYLLL